MNILYSCAQFIIKIGEKSNLFDDFNTLMMILDSGLLFWATLYIVLLSVKANPRVHFGNSNECGTALEGRYLVGQAVNFSVVFKYSPIFYPA